MTLEQMRTFTHKDAYEGEFKCGNCFQTIKQKGEHFNLETERYECCKHPNHVYVEESALIKWLKK